MDERGYLRITDRKKDMFIVGGFNVYPAEVENAILAHPAVAQVAVVSAPDSRMGEVGVAFVVPRAGSSVDPEELLAWCATRMANYKVPRRAVVVDALPVNASGKVLKYELREQV
jgi:acyl-CoA synthetase (AMP-forming)/AMP-acid ligase II